MRVLRAVVDVQRLLRGGADGLFFIKKFLKSAKDYLNPGGQIWLEFDTGQKKAIEKIGKNLGYQPIQFRRDQFGRWRFVILQNII